MEKILKNFMFLDFDSFYMFLSLNVVVEASDTDREMKPVSEQQSETEETIDIGEQSETEDSADQITDLNAPEQMSVQSLEEELLAVARMEKKPQQIE